LDLTFVIGEEENFKREGKRRERVERERERERGRVFTRGVTYDKSKSKPTAGEKLNAGIKQPSLW